MSMASISSLCSLRARRACVAAGEALNHSALFSSRHNHHRFFSSPGLVRLPLRISTSRRLSTMAAKIDLYSMSTPNGVKISIALEEMGIDYTPHLIHIGKNDQFTPEFIAINPNSKIPAIVDPNGPDGKPINVFESGAILLYLAEKSGKFLSTDPRLKWETVQWVFFQVGGVGPMFGQFGHFYLSAKDKCLDPYPVGRYATETKRLLGVLEKRLEGRQYLVGDEYSIADIATMPWVRGVDSYAGEYLGLSDFPGVLAWKDRCLERPATQRGLTVCQPS